MNIRRHLIAVMTCDAPSYRAKADAQRRTWVPALRALGFDVMFFRGLGHPLLSRLDEVLLRCGDHYVDIPHKVKIICDYAASYGYEHVTKMDDDVYVVPQRFADLSFRNRHYVGRFRGPHGNYPVSFASGFCYTLSNEAARVVARTPWNGDWMDERFVATALACAGLCGHTDPLNYLVCGFLKPFEIFANRTLGHGAVFCEFTPDKISHMHRLFRDETTQRYTALECVPLPMLTLSQQQVGPIDAPAPEKLTRYV